MPLALYEPSSDQTNKMACAPSEDTDQPRLIWVFEERTLILLVLYCHEQQKRMTLMHVCCAVLRPSQQSVHVESVGEPTHTVHGQICLVVN